MQTKFDEVMTKQGRKDSWLAELLRVSSATITRWRKGQRAPSLSHKRHIAYLLGVPMDELFPEEKEANVG